MNKLKGAEEGAQVLKQLGDVLKVIDLNDTLSLDRTDHSMLIISSETGFYFGRYNPVTSKILVTS